MKKLKYFFASAIVLVALAISTIVFAEYKEQKGDLRANNQISNKNVSITIGNETLSDNGSVKVVKTVSKTDTEGIYNIKFDISAKEKENKSTTPIYAALVFDNSGSMICDSSLNSYAYSKSDAEQMTEDYNWRYSKNENINYYFEEYKSALGDNTSIYCTKYYEKTTDNGRNERKTELVQITGDVVLKNKWESAVSGAKAFTEEILSIDSSKISYVPFATSASTASTWYAKGDTIPSSVYSHPVGATNLSGAINEAYSKLSESTIPTDAKKIIIVLSDGEPTQPGRNPIESAKRAATTAKNAGIKIYTIGYAVEKDSTAATVLSAISSNSTLDTNSYSFLAGQDQVTDIFKKLATAIKYDYAKNATLTDTIGGSFKFTSSDYNVNVNGQEVNFTIDKLTTTSQSFSFNIKIDDENITEDGWLPTNDGFKLTYTDVDGKSQTLSTNNNPEVYWIATRYDYSIEYYYDNIKDANLTETGKDVKGKEITVSDEKIKSNTKEGYSLVSTNPTNGKITISSDKDKNVIKVYYEKNSYDYEVHYYYNGIEDKTLVETKSAKYEEKITKYTDKVKTGYKFSKTENLPLTIGIDETKNIINVYYITDESQTKTLSYTVEYYKDNVLEETSLPFEETKQVLEDDTLTVLKDKINTKDKYTGYKFVKTNPEVIPDKIENKGVIKVYYEKDSFGYTVEYYYDGKIDSSKTETGKALYEEEITKYTDKNITGYVFSEVENLPLIISENAENNVIKVYYEKGTYKYTVNYYYNNVIDEDKTDTFEAKYNDVITTYEQKIKTGYVLDKVTGLELTISDKDEENVINVYYKKAKYSYVVEYYYDDILDKTKTDTFEETYNEVIDKYEDKVIDGYILDKVEGTPLTISENAEDNVIKVYYKKGSYTYEIRYYFNRILDESLTEKGTKLYGDTITSYTDKIKEDYVLETVENLPLEISSDETKNIINVYYKIDGQGVIEEIVEPPHTSVNNSIYALVILVNALGLSVILKKREN